MSANLEKLRVCLKNHQSVLVAFSGGVDSSLLLAVSVEQLGKRVLAVTAKSPTFTERELKTAILFAAQKRARHVVIDAREIEDPEFLKNSKDRCYVCKRKRFQTLVEFSAREGLAVVIDGSNQDDLNDFRPGLRATQELGVKSPFVELGFTKETIRSLAKEQGLLVWNSPSSACLASRIPYGQPITLEKLHRIEEAEEFLRSLGFVQYRVRDHGEIARIEVGNDEMPRFQDQNLRQQVIQNLQRIGYAYISLDLGGYRSGSMNEVI